MTARPPLPDPRLTKRSDRTLGGPTPHFPLSLPGLRYHG